MGRGPDSSIEISNHIERERERDCCRLTKLVTGASVPLASIYLTFYCSLFTKKCAKGIFLLKKSEKKSILKNYI